MTRRNSSDLIYNYPELSDMFNKVCEKWQWQFATPENKESINREMLEIVNSHIRKNRDEKINSILK